MKKLLSLSMFLAFTLLLTNCKKDKDSEIASWTSTVDGATFAGNYGVGHFYTDVKEFALVLYQSNSQLNKYIEISISPTSPDEVVTGKTYIIESSEGIYQDASVSQYSTPSSANTITFSKYDKSSKKASGTFTFKARTTSSFDEILVTGSFTNIQFAEL